MTGMLRELLILVAIDALFLGLFVLVLLPLSKFRRPAFAILKRNFTGYFMNPTGYVFLCLFVLLSSFAAFWPNEFFAANLASLHQLNLYLPYIMLVFIPAITMSIWSEERRQGTDELLLTLPADDFDVVIGKYLAAIAIYSCSLLFAQISHYAVLVLLTLGELDTGLLCATYFGYWLTGLAMISIGMVASFLTRNLTVGFILGALFNAPLVFFQFAEVIIPGRRLAQMIASWSISAKFDDFGRGVISLSSVTYFVMIIAVGLYLSMVLIGSRHWWGGRDGTSLIGHYFTRTASLVLVAISLTVTFTYHDWRQDLTKGQVSSLSPDTLRLIRNLKPQYPVYVDAYIGAQIPKEYVQTEYNLRSLLKEFASRSSNVHVRLHDNLEPYSDQAVLAEQRFGIVPQAVQTRSRGAIKSEQVILGAAFTSGLEKVVVPFFDYGISVEYELIRSINTVAKARRPKLGVVRTDAQLFAMPSFQGGQFRQLPQQLAIDELQKQYDVEQVDPETAIEVGKFDVLLVAQPSAMSPEGLENLMTAIKAGQPTAIFEDPMPEFIAAPGTGEPRQGQNAMMGMMGQQPQPKGDLTRLWDLLGISMPADPGGMGGPQPKLAWQTYNPYPKLQLEGITDQWIFASPDAEGGLNSINREHPITSGLREILFPTPGSILEKPSNDLEVTKLITTAPQSGTISLTTYRENMRSPGMVKLLQGEAKGEQVLAVDISGELPETKKLLDDAATKAGTDAAKGDAAKSDAAKKDGASEKKGIHVVYVADLDVMASVFLQLRARPGDDPDRIQWKFENVTFLLNIVDYLAGELDYIGIRKHRPMYYSLRHVESQADVARFEETQKQFKFQNEFDSELAKAESELQAAVKGFQDRYDELVRKQRAGENIDPDEIRVGLQTLQAQQELANRRIAQKRRELERQRDKEIKDIRRTTDRMVADIQDKYKLGAVVLPPLPPLLIGIVVFTRRRLREREGISRSRLVI